MPQDLLSLVKKACKSIKNFATIASGITLRKYQEGPATAIVDSVLNHRGLTFVVVYPRQSGKNETQAQIEAYLLTLFNETNAEIVKVSPTWKPQSLNSMRRLERVLQKNLIARILWSKESGFIFRVGTARIYFLSGAPEANIVGATASLLLEAQDVQIAKFDKDVSPMAASTNATRVFWGTAWTSQTLLARELNAAKQAEKLDGIKRVYFLTADDVAKEVPAYGDHVREQIAKLGRMHPMIKTQYFSEEITGQGGLFTPERISMMLGKHLMRTSPEVGKIYSMLLDVAGEDENQPQGMATSTKRDSTSLTIVEVDLATMENELIRKPTFKGVYRKAWIGIKHVALYGEIKALFDLWNCRYLVIDATGIGAGLASFLESTYPGRVYPFVFSGATKSEMGWAFISVIETGRYKEYKPLDPEFEGQLKLCGFEIVPGPDKKIKWGVADGTKDPETGKVVHDDLILSAALVTVLDGLDWAVTSPAYIIQAKDPLLEMNRGF
jgi:hypothetical protein